MLVLQFLPHAAVQAGSTAVQLMDVSFALDTCFGENLLPYTGANLVQLKSSDRQ